MKNLISTLVFAVLIGCSADNKDTHEPITKNIAWCVNVCMEDILKDMHNTHESSSSLSGMFQSNTIINILEYCKMIYSFECYKVKYTSDAAIHESGIHGAANKL